MRNQLLPHYYNSIIPILSFENIINLYTLINNEGKIIKAE